MNRQRLLTSGFWLLAFGIMLNLNSCSSERKTTKSSLRSYNANRIVKEVEENSFEFDNIQTKLDIRYKDDKNSLGLKGQLRMQKDSVIWLSLSLKVGIEIGRLMITQDSVKFMNRNNKTYIAESLDILNDKLPIEPSVDFFQDLFVGNDTQLKIGDKYKVSTDDDKYKLEIISLDILKDIWVTPESFKISKYKLKEHNNGNRKIQLEYSDFKNYNEKLLPSKIMFGLSSDNDIEVEINYSNVTVNEEIAFPFNITNKFERIYLW